MKWWEIYLRGGPAERLYTEAGIKNVLPQILEDLDFYTRGDTREFVRILLESFPFELYPLSVTMYDWVEENDEGEAKLLRFYPEWVRDELDLDTTDVVRLERSAERILLPTVSEPRAIGGSVVRQFGNIRVTYSGAQGEPSHKELYAVLNVFDRSGRSEATVLLKGSRSVIVEGDEAVVEDEEMELFLERLRKT
ncbi:MAG: hypothetical protein ACE5IJ_04550 [Thermoplasmata archaeon]